MYELLTMMVAAVSVAEANSVADEPSPPEVVVTGVRTSNGYTTSSSDAAKIDVPLRDVPQTIDVVPSAVLRDQRALSVQDALKNVPGVGFSHGDGQRDQVTIRGFSAIADQFVDGYRDDALYFRDLSNVERIEVLKGPSSVLYGRGSSGGLINRVTRKPGVDTTSGVVTLGSFASKRAEGDIGRAGQLLSWRLTGAIERSDSFRDKQFLNREALAPSLLIRPTNQTEILLQADFLHDRRLTDFGIPAYRGRPVEVDRSTYYGAANAREADYSRSRVWSQTVGLTHRISESLSFRNGFRHYSYDLDRRNTLPGSVNEAAQTVSLNRSTVHRNEQGWSDQAELTLKARVGGTSHTLLYGIELAHQRKDVETHSKNAIAVVDLFEPVQPIVPVVLSGAPSADNRGIFDSKAIYIQDLVDLGGGFKALAGIRRDWFKQRTEQRIATIPNVGRKDREWSPRAGLVFQPDPVQSYYASWSRSFQPSGEAFSIAANNSQIAPEKTTNREVGAKYEFLSGKLNVTASLFELKRTGIKSASPSAPSVLIPIGTQRTRGLELSGVMDLPSGWRAIGGYSYLDGRIVHSIAVDAGQEIEGKRPTITPMHSANLFVTRSFGERFGLGAGSNYVGKRFANPGNTVELPSFVTVDAMAWVKAGPIRLQANVNNVFNQDYIVSAHGTSPNLNLPGAPRTLLLSAQVAM